MIEDYEQFDNDDALTQSLRAWGEARRATDEQLARMRRVIATAADDRANPVSPTASDRKLPGAWGALGLVLALLVAFALSLPDVAQRDAVPVRSTPDHVQRRLPDAPASFAAMDEAQVQQQQALVAELDSVFPHQWQWLAESPGEVRVEVGRQTTIVDNAVAVRIIVARRSVGEEHWKPVWSVDCLARGEEVVRLQPSGDGFHGSIVLWTYPIGDGLVAIDSDVQLHDARLQGQDLRASFRGAQRDRVPQQISAVQESDHTEYQIFQTVANVREAAL